MIAAHGTDDVRISWVDSDTRRFERDRTEIEADWPGLRWASNGAGGWHGALPVWPFDRPAPNGIDELTRGAGLQTVVAYSQAYPMVQPSIRPIAPCPLLSEWTMHKWHVNGDGSLCLLQSVSAWDPRASISELLLKAAGWRVEYALMKAGVIETMTVNGIASDPSLDALIAEAANRVGETS